MSTPNSPARSPLRGWALEFARRWNAGVSSVFVLHGNIHDVFATPEGAAGAAAYLPLKGFVTRRLFADREWLLFYDIGDGLTFGSAEMQREFFEWLASLRPGGRNHLFPNWTAAGIHPARAAAAAFLSPGSPTRTARPRHHADHRFPREDHPGGRRRRQHRGAHGARDPAQMGVLAGHPPAGYRRDFGHGIRAGIARRSAAQPARRAASHRAAGGGRARRVSPARAGLAAERPRRSRPRRAHRWAEFAAHPPARRRGGEQRPARDARARHGDQEAAHRGVLPGPGALQGSEARRLTRSRGDA